ncbi:MULTISPECIES: glycosyltransferase family 2 protein [Leuconostoc]|uniref:glycosyltransferase family 2 protein n=1 Tax=Leuconostoc TaxID=1243 RepID=UPI001B8D85D9|nr:glycosyltransferase family 2 protein [Leuconostoc suionicum]MBS1008509.1 glycosyltransferase family 2 protein [Leuconostoc suionicum]
MNNQEESVEVSVVIPVYNVKKFLPHLFSNINKQVYDNFEVIFIDDGSTDGSGQLLDKECETNKKFKVIHQNNFGTGYSRNVGIANSNGKYIFFMDPDDTMNNRLLLDNVKIIDEKNADIVVFGFNTINDQGTILDSKRYTINQSKLNGYSVPKYFEELYRQLVFNTLWHKIIRKSFIVDNNVTSPLWSNSQDRGLLLKLALHNPNIVFNFDDIAYYNYVLMRTGASTANFKKNLIDIGFNSASCVEDIVNKFGIVKTRKLAYEVYVRNIYGYAGMVNVLRGNGPNSFHQKVKYINQIYNDNVFIKNAFSGVTSRNDLNLKQRLVIFCVKHKMTPLMLFLKSMRK